jgi:uncharacterized protein
VFASALTLALLGGLSLPDRPMGRVHDAASVLSPSARAQLEERLRAYEARTSNQVVVATFPSLEGDDIADVGYRLGQKWGIGQQGRDNGVLFVVAVAERRMRIEVGKGLEGALTDLQAKIILDEVVRPALAQGRFDLGVLRGTEAILQATAGEFRGRGQVTRAPVPLLAKVVIGVLLLVLFIFFPRAGMLVLWSLASGGRRRGGGGFSGGGGRFGGGGASGSW